MMKASYAGLRARLSLAALVLVNLVPLYGVLVHGWDVGALILLYWAENVVLGSYTLLRMLVVAPVGGWFSGLFFCLHYGAFCAVHGLMIVSLLIDEDFKPIDGKPWPLFLAFIQLLFRVIERVLADASALWLLGLAALFMSHGVSFVMNFLLAGERHRLSVSAIMMAPYPRIVVLHVAVLVGGMLAVALGQPTGMLAVLVALKLGVDVYLHRREHLRLAGSE